MLDISLLPRASGRLLDQVPQGSRSVISATRRLLEHGTEVSPPGLDPARGDYASFANFSDPDGNSWVLQERSYGNV